MGDRGGGDNIKYLFVIRGLRHFITTRYFILSGLLHRSSLQKKIRRRDNMTFSDYYCRKIPEYYPSMYLDGFTPNEILYACRQTMLHEA
jgi:hypothetical protein